MHILSDFYKKQEKPEKMVLLAKVLETPTSKIYGEEAIVFLTTTTKTAAILASLFHSPRK